MNKKALLSGIIFSLAALTGCGGGSSSSATTATAPTTRLMVTNNLRTYVTGDNIQYSLTGSVTKAGVTTTLTGTAVDAFTIGNSPIDPKGVKRSLDKITIIATFSNGSPFAVTVNTYFSQDVLGNYNLYGDNSGANAASNWITTPASGFVTQMKSPISFPSTWNNSYTLQNGDKITENTTVLGKATITIGLGSFETYKVQFDTSTAFALGGTNISKETDYIVPSIGLIQSSGTTTSTDAVGVVTTSNMNLVVSTTNIAF